MPVSPKFIPDIRTDITIDKRLQGLDVNQLNLEAGFEIGYSPVGMGTISFVNVSTSIGPSQSPS